VPATSAGLPRVGFFFSFFVAVAIYSTNKANKAGSTCHSAVYKFLDVYGMTPQEGQLEALLSCCLFAEAAAINISYVSVHSVVYYKAGKLSS
jgi:hypothetical protein